MKIMQKTQSEEALGEHCAREAAVIGTLLVTQPLLSGSCGVMEALGGHWFLKPCRLIVTLILKRQTPWERGTWSAHCEHSA